MMTNQLKLIDNRYQILQRLGEGSNAIVYQALDKETGREVAIKLMSVQRQDAEGILRFNKEVEIMSKLHHPHIIELYGYGMYEGASYLVMEIVKGQSLDQLLEKGTISVERAVDILQQITDALIYVHEHEIIHRDLKPQNIMLVNGEVKVMDFCLSRLINVESAIDKGSVVGTFMYMPPEQAGTLHVPVDDRSDLYSLGIIIYELLTGRLPFTGEDIASLLQQHLTALPQKPKDLNPEIPEILQRIVLKLLQKIPNERYQSAKGLLADTERLKQLIKENRTDEIFELGTKDTAQRLSYHVKMAGRKEELTNLEHDLTLVEKGEGRFCMVSGVAGMGKTRLIDEVRIGAEGKRALFISGKCNKYEATLPYSPFVEAITEYVNIIKRRSKQEREIQVNKIKEGLGELGRSITQIVPALKELIGETPSLVALEPDQEKTRFYTVMLSFFSAVVSEKNPLVIFLDDLQWTDLGTLELLSFLIPRISSSSLFILGSYREEEITQAHPLIDLLNDLKKREIVFREISLKPLGQQEIGQIIMDTFGYHEEVAQDLLIAVKERTQGNPFYTLQMLRSMVDQEIMRFENNKWIFNPQRFKEVKIANTLLELLLERLRTLKPEVIEVLSFASIIGRDFSYELLQFITKMPIEKIVEALDEALFQIFIWEKPGFKKGIYSFSHDKVVEALYEKIPGDKRAGVHEEIAKSLEESYKEKPEEVIYELAHHYFRGLNKEKALNYLVMAGDRAMESYANEEVVRFFGRGLEVLEEKGEKAGSQLWLKLKEGMGDSYCLLGAYDKAMACYEEARQFTRDALSLASLLEKEGNTIFAKGDLPQAAPYLEKGLSILNLKIPKTAFGVLFLLFSQVLIQVVHTFFPFVYSRHKLKDKPVVAQSVKVLSRLSYVYYYFNTLKALSIHFLALNICEHIGPSKELCHIYRTHGMALASIPLFKRALKYTFRSLEMAKEIGDPLGVAAAQGFLGLLYYYASEWDEAIKWSLQCKEGLEKVGDRWTLIVAILNIAFAYHYKSDFDQAIKYEQIGYDAAALINDIRGMGQALIGMAWALAIRGETEEANRCFNKGIELIEKTGNSLVIAMSWRIYVKFLIKEGDLKKAIELGRKSRDLIEKNFIRSEYIVQTYPVLAEALLKSAEKTDSIEEKKKLLKEAASACKQGYALAIFFKNQLGYVYRVRGVYECLQGKTQKGKKYFMKSVKILEKQKNKYELAQTFAELARFFPKGG